MKRNINCKEIWANERNKPVDQVRSENRATPSLIEA